MICRRSTACCVVGALRRQANITCISFRLYLTTTATAASSAARCTSVGTANKSAGLCEIGILDRVVVGTQPSGVSIDAMHIETLSAAYD